MRRSFCTWFQSNRSTGSWENQKRSFCLENWKIFSEEKLFNDF